jgi:hypothetical protein|nr:MAG TPA: hypothetical protein [Caudoviricetes sp.]
MESGIDMTKPQPCNMFDVADVEAWGIELSKGVYEVIKWVAYMDNFLDCVDRDDEACLAEELTNVITVCTSWLDALGYNEARRGEMQRLVNEKNKDRGYF